LCGALTQLLPSVSIGYEQHEVVSVWYMVFVRKHTSPWWSVGFRPHYKTVCMSSRQGLLGCDAMQCCGKIPMYWRQYGPPKCLYSTMTLHGISTQKTLTCIFTAARTSNLVILHVNDQSECMWVTTPFLCHVLGKLL